MALWARSQICSCRQPFGHGCQVVPSYGSVSPPARANVRFQRAWAGRLMGTTHSIASSDRDPMKVIAKFLSEQFSQVPLLAADGSFVQYDKTAPILELPNTHVWLALEEILQAPWKVVKDICDPRVAPSEKGRLASYSTWLTLEEEVPVED